LKTGRKKLQLRSSFAHASLLAIDSANLADYPSPGSTVVIYVSDYE